MKKLLLPVLVCLNLFLFAQPSNFTMLGRWAEGVSSNVVVKNNLAFIGNGTSITVLDISDSNNPIKMSEIILPDVVFDLDMNGNYIYAAMGVKGLAIVDAGNINDLKMVGSFETYNKAEKVKYYNNHVYLVQNGIDIIDVSTAAAPQKVGSIFNSEVADLAFDGNQVFAACKDQGLYIYDISSPSAPVFKKVLQDGYYPCVKVKNNYVYAQVNTNIGSRFMVYDVSNLDSVKQVAELAVRIDNMTLAHDTIFATTISGEMNIIDVSNPKSPVITGGLPFFSLFHPTGISVSGNNILVTEGARGLRIFDAKNHGNIHPVGKYVGASYFTEMILKDDKIFASDLENGLFVVDIKNDAAPNCILKFNPESTALIYKGLALAGNYAFLASNTGLYILNITDLQNISVVKTITQKNIQKLKVSGNNLYVTSTSAPGFRIYSITDPENPVEKGTITDAFTAFEVENNLAYLIKGNESGVTIVDVADPDNPLVKSSYDVSQIYYYRDIEVVGNYVFTVGHGLNIADVSNPDSPLVVGVYGGIDYGASVRVVGNDVYVSNEDGIAVVSKADPQNPVVVNKFDTPNTYASCICTNQSIVYLNQVNYGIFVLRNNLPTNANSIGCNSGDISILNYPNPFHNQTIIEYQLMETGFVNFEVFDMDGRKVKTLVNELKTEGQYSLKWIPEVNGSKQFVARLMLNGKLVGSKIISKY